jgi:hypothetical protein
MARVVSQRVQAVDAAPWPLPVREFSVNGYIAIVLASEAEIREEWGAMRNCALEHIAGCRQGTHVTLSLRDRETGERAVTIVLKREHGRYVALEARRRFNRPAGLQLWSVAQRAAAIYESACSARVMRRATTCRRANRAERSHSSETLIGSQAAFDFASE